MNLRTVALAALFTFALAACGGSETVVDTEAAVSPASPAETVAEAETADTSDTVSAEQVVEDALETAEDFADDMVESLEETQAAVGGGSVTLTVGDQSWTFESALCAFGSEEIGQEGAEFVLSSIQDGMQMYFSIDSFGHSASLNDIKDFENPSVSLDSAPSGDFITLDGKSFSGAADFHDGTVESFDTVPGTFSGTCP